MTKSSAPVPPQTDFIELVYHVSEREKVIVALAFMDDALKRMLRARFLCECGDEPAVDTLISDDSRAICSVSLRTKTARALGLISAKIAAAIDAVRKMRNDRAHDIQAVQIATPDVDRIASQLDRAIYDIFRTLAEDGKINDSYKFCICANALSAELRGIAAAEESRWAEKRPH